MHDERRPPAEDCVVAIEPAYRVADMTALLEAHDVGIAKVPASRPLQQIAADGAEVANLRRRRFASRLGERRETRAHNRMRRDVAKARERTDAQAAVGRRIDSLEFLEPIKIDQRVRRGDLLLEQVERVDPAGERHMAGLREQAHGARQIGGRHDLEAVHGTSTNLKLCLAQPARGRA
jgi:hypothetical protein